MKANSLFELLKHFTDSELGKMEIQIFANDSNTYPRRRVQKLRLECENSCPDCFDRISQNYNLIIIVD